MRSEARLPMHPPVSRYDQGPRSGHTLDGFHTEPEGLPGWAIAGIAAFAFGLVCGLISLLRAGGL